MMKTRVYARVIIAACAALACGGISGCTKTVTKTEVREVVVDARYATDLPGAVEEVWEEPMTDVIDVPPGLDAEGHYYRPAHQEIVEIRQGRWKYYRSGNAQ